MLMKSLFEGVHAVAAPVWYFAICSFPSGLPCCYLLAHQLFCSLVFFAYHPLSHDYLASRGIFDPSADSRQRAENDRRPVWPQKLSSGRWQLYLAAVDTEALGPWSWAALLRLDVVSFRAR